MRTRALSLSSESVVLVTRISLPMPFSILIGTILVTRLLGGNKSSLMKRSNFRSSVILARSASDMFNTNTTKKLRLESSSPLQLYSWILYLSTRSHGTSTEKLLSGAVYTRHLPTAVVVFEGGVGEGTLGDAEFDDGTLGGALPQVHKHVMLSMLTAKETMNFIRYQRYSSR